MELQFAVCVAVSRVGAEVVAEGGKLVGGGVPGAVAIRGGAVAVGAVIAGEVAGAHNADGGCPGGVRGEAANPALKEIERAHDDGAHGDAGERPEGAGEDVGSVAARLGDRGGAFVVSGGRRDCAESREREGGDEGQAEEERLHTG